jgi:hypothetical protein
VVVAELTRLITSIRKLEYHNPKVQLIASREEHSLVYDQYKGAVKGTGRVILILILVVLGT